MGAMFKELGQKVASSTRPVFTAQHGTGEYLASRGRIVGREGEAALLA